MKTKKNPRDQRESRDGKKKYNGEDRETRTESESLGQARLSALRRQLHNLRSRERELKLELEELEELELERELVAEAYSPSWMPMGSEGEAEAARSSGLMMGWLRS